MAIKTEPKKDNRVNVLLSGTWSIMGLSRVVRAVIGVKSNLHYNCSVCNPSF